MNQQVANKSLSFCLIVNNPVLSQETTANGHEEYAHLRLFSQDSFTKSESDKVSFHTEKYSLQKNVIPAIVRLPVSSFHSF